MFAFNPCQDQQWVLTPSSLPSSGVISNTGRVCPEVFSPSFIMATPTSYFPSTYPTIPTLPSSYSTTPTPDLSTSFLLKGTSTHISSFSPSSINNKQSQFTTEPIKMYSSLVTVTNFSRITYTLPYSSPIPTLATPTLIIASHTNGTSVPQTSARSSLTSPGASPSPTMLFCSASENGKWPITRACANATSTDCGNNSHANG